TCSLDRAHARVIPCFIAFGDPVFIRSAELSGIQRAFFIKNLLTSSFSFPICILAQLQESLANHQKALIFSWDRAGISGQTSILPLSLPPLLGNGGMALTG
ncbi:MAG: hypothetical protein ABSB32_05680, partial [Thermodesulfobacteriota bacterium]